MEPILLLVLTMLAIVAVLLWSRPAKPVIPTLAEIGGLTFAFWIVVQLAIWIFKLAS